MFNKGWWAPSLARGASPLECCSSCNSAAHLCVRGDRIKANTAFHKAVKVFGQQ